MLGSISDTYDPEFSTVANREDVINAMKEKSEWIGTLLGPELKNIVGVVQNEDFGERHSVRLSEHDLRILRYALNTAIECLSL